MILNMKRVVLEIEHRGTARVNATAGTRIDCLRGCAWITECGARDDIVLQVGESYVVSRGGITVVQGLREEALVALRGPAVHDFGSAVAAWVERLWSRWAPREAAC